MQMPKASGADKQRFRDLIEPLHSEVYVIEVKPMFGQLGAFVNGNMFAGLFGEAVGVKLNATDYDDLAAAGGSPFGPAERPMGGYLTIPPTADAEHWLGRALGYVGSLPPKAPKGSRSRAAAEMQAPADSGRA